MQLSAWELGVGSCIASIYEPEKAREILGFPLEWHLRIALSFGYPLDEEKLTAEPKKGGTFRMGLGHGATTDSLDPATYPDQFTGTMGWGATGNSLVELNAKGGSIWVIDGIYDDRA